ncbi:MAG TPA: HAD-IA family hydrolase [Actinomycetota bacterium]|nr:HAD-IA family hydrolase [Actinomycetota bacterium]
MSRLPPIPDPLHCVLFDAGDTLLAPAPSFQGRFVAVAAAHGLPLEEAAVDAAIAEAVRAAEWPADWTDPATQRSFWVGFYRQVLAALGHEGPEGSGEPQGGAPVGLELAEALFAAFSDPAGYRLFDDARPALEALAGRGLRLGVVSNFEPWLEDVLALEGVDHLFAAVAISGKLGVAKPDPEIFLAALAEAGADPAATVHVGDQPANDVAAARAVGITPVLIDRFARHPGPDGVHRVEDLLGLVRLLNGHGSG